MTGVWSSRAVSWGCALTLGMVSGCPEEQLPPPPIATGGTLGGVGGEGADETGDGDPVGVECDVWQQDCPPGEKCAPVDPAGVLRWTESRCVPVDPSPVGMGVSCTMPNGPGGGVDDCPVDGFCYFSDLAGQRGRCVPFCQGGPEAPVCPEGMACGWGNGGAIALCRASCDPLVQDCELNNATCLPTPSGTEFVCYVHQWDRGGAGCTAYNGCPAGEACVPAEWVDMDAKPGMRKCEPFCAVGEGLCPVGMVCKGWPDGSVSGHPDVGVCVVP